VVLLSRSGKSVEILHLLEKCRVSGAKIIGITNTPGSRLAREADVVLQLHAEFDHLISISMYSTLAMIAAVLAAFSMELWSEELNNKLNGAILAACSYLHRWKAQLDASDWLEPSAMTYFLARGASLASAHESRLLWEEGAKAPAAVVPTGGFRHGPQEAVSPGLRVCLWLDSEKMRQQDLELAKDLHEQGAKVLAVGQDLPSDAADLVLQLPAIPPEWQFVLDIIPLQIAAERLAQLRQVDCDSFRFCSYIIETEGGLKTRA
jgi:glucosamine--fructose-6-phosphate aminotransferase (isomerizing)